MPRSRSQRSSRNHPLRPLPYRTATVREQTRTSETWYQADSCGRPFALPCWLCPVVLLSRRAETALEAGRLKAATSLPIYEPAREKLIYENIRRVNQGPLPDIELTHIFERIIDVMRALQRNELASLRNAQALAQPAAVSHEAGVQSPETGKRQ